MAYDSTKKYVTRDSYEQFSGIDLNIELKSSQYDNPTQAVNIFLKQQQTWLYTKTQTDYRISEWDDDTFAEALLWQIKHVLKYGEDEKMDSMAYNIMHESGMINPSQQDRVYRWY